MSVQDVSYNQKVENLVTLCTSKFHSKTKGNEQDYHMHILKGKRFEKHMFVNGKLNH